MQMVRCYPGAGDGSRGSARTWVKGKMEEDVLSIGEPRPALYVVHPDHVDTFDLNAASRADPEGHAGATLAALREAAGAIPVFLVIRLEVTLDDGTESLFGMALEVFGEPPRAWSAWLEYAIDPVRKTAEARGWRESEEPVPLARVQEPFEELFRPPISARPFQVEPPASGPVPVNAAFLTRPAPSGARELCELAAQEVARSHLAGRLHGTTLLRTAGDQVEIWNLGELERHPAPLDEIMRIVANRPDDPADGIAMVALCAFSDTPEQPPRGIQILAEHADGAVERRLYLDASAEEMRVVSDVIRVLADKPGRWLGVAPTVELEWVPLDGAEA